MQKLVELKQAASDAASKKFNDIFKLLADSVELSCFGRARVNEARRNNILSTLNSSYRQLATTPSASEGLLFGKNLEDAMQSVDSVNELSERLASRAPAAPRNPVSASQFPFLGQRPQGRSRGYPRGRHQPYYHSQSHGQNQGQPRQTHPGKSQSR